MPPLARIAPLDRILRPVHQWVWSDFDRRVRKLLAFGEVESDGGRDILRAAELTPDPLLRRLYLEHHDPQRWKVSPDKAHPASRA